MSSKPLKLKFGAPKPPKAESPAEPPPSATSTGAPKLKLNFKAKSETAPKSATSTPAKKPARKPKPTPKKRAAEEALQGDGGSGKATTGPKPVKKLKLKTRPSLGEEVKFLKIKTKGKPLRRPPGVGYDSEASDQEEDPTITDNVILRMPPGPECDALRNAITKKKIGIPKEEGGVNLRMRFFADGRRGWISFQGKTYAMILVDLPCIIEAMKSWEKKMWWKSGDVWQMILVLGVVKNEDEAAAYPLLNGSKKGEIDEKTFQYAHGLTPPLRWVRKRRFRKRISVRAVEEEEEEVERLLKADRECLPGTSRVKIYDSVEEYDRQKEASTFDDEGEDEGSDAETDEDEEEEEEEEGGEDATPLEPNEEDDALAAEMEAAMAAEADAEEASAAAAAISSTSTPASAVTSTPLAVPLASPSSALAATSPAITALQAADSPTAAITSSSDPDDESDEDESDEDDAGGEDSEDVEADQERQRQKEEIQDLENAIREQKQALGRQTNAILKKKLVGKIESLEADLETRRTAMGLSEGDD